MFLGDCEHSPLEDLDEIESSIIKGRAAHLAQVREHLKKRLQTEYLSLLVEKGKRNIRELKTGDVVLIGSDDKKRLEWPMGIIVKLFQGRDGKIRVAKVKVKQGELIRPLQRLYPLEIESSDNFKIINEVKGIDTDELNGNNACFDFSDDEVLEQVDKSVELTPQLSKASRCGRLVKRPARFL